MDKEKSILMSAEIKKACIEFIEMKKIPIVLMHEDSPKHKTYSYTEAIEEIEKETELGLLIVKDLIRRGLDRLRHPIPC